MSLQVLAYDWTYLGVRVPVEALGRRPGRRPFLSDFRFTLSGTAGVKGQGLTSFTGSSKPIIGLFIEGCARVNWCETTHTNG